MTSVFGGLYLDNLRRVTSSSSSQQSIRTKAPNKTSESFAGVLAEVENNRNISSKNKDLSPYSGSDRAGVSNGSGQILSNLNASQTEYRRASFGPLDASSRTSVAKTIEELQNAPSSVKSPAVGVNALPPRPVLPPAPLVETASSVPTTPVVVSSKRVGYQGAEIHAKISAHFSKDDIKEIVVTAGRFHGVDPSLSLAVAKAESSFQRHAVSSDGHYSKGVFQLLDSTGKDMLQLSGMEEQEYDPFDPGQNAFLGTRYLRRLMDIFSAETKLTSSKTTMAAKSSQELEKLAVAAFNAGEGRVASAQQKALAAGEDPGTYQGIEKFLPKTTQTYVQRVNNFQGALSKEFEENKKA